MNTAQKLAAAKLSVFTENHGQSPADYAAAQMQGRGSLFTSGPFKDTGRKLVAAQAVNGVALVTLSRVNLTDAVKHDVKGFQITAYDLAGNVLSETPLDDTAPKGTKRGYAVYGEVLKEIASRNDLVNAAIRSEAEALAARSNELFALLDDEAEADSVDLEEAA